VGIGVGGEAARVGAGRWGMKDDGEETSGRACV
jgi:hypothetical protein